jgi:hypothetical protein
LRAPDGPEDQFVAASLIREGGFEIAVPSGSYQLEVDVPGFRPFQKEVQVSGATEIEIELQNI